MSLRERRHLRIAAQLNAKPLGCIHRFSRHMPSSIAHASVAIILSPVLGVRLISRRLLGIGAVAGGCAAAPALPRAGRDCRRAPPRAHPDAAHGAHRAGPTTRHESTASRASGVPLSAAPSRGHAAERRVGHGYHRHPDRQRLCVPGRGAGLGEPSRTQLARVDHPGHHVLPGGRRGGCLALPNHSPVASRYLPRLRLYRKTGALLPRDRSMATALRRESRSPSGR